MLQRSSKQNTVYDDEYSCFVLHPRFNGYNKTPPAPLREGKESIKLTITIPDICLPQMPNLAHYLELLIPARQQDAVDLFAQFKTPLPLRYRVFCFRPTPCVHSPIPSFPILSGGNSC